MTHNMKRGQRMRRLGFGAVLLGLVAPFAVAGPEQDSEQAEKEFARGDLIASMVLWQKAAQQGYAPAQVRLADILNKSEDDEEAIEWYRKAAAQGNAAGEYGLGQMYATGEGIKHDLAQARSYILRAAEKNYVPAMTFMMEACRTGGLDVTRDLAQADVWEAKLLAISPTYRKTPVRDMQKKKNTDGKGIQK